MRSVTLSLLSCLLWMLPLSAHAAEVKNIVVIGDSLSAAYGIEQRLGWVSLLQSHLDTASPHRYRVINASVSGETTRGGLSRLPLSLKQHKPEIVIIALGGNDGLRGLSLKELRHNLNAMVELAKQANAKVMLCGVRIPPNLGPAYVSGFIGAYAQTAQTHGIPLVQYLLKGVATQPKLMQADRTHPTAEAQPIILNNVLSQLNTLL